MGRSLALAYGARMSAVPHKLREPHEAPAHARHKGRDSGPLRKRSAPSRRVDITPIPNKFMGLRDFLAGYVFRLRTSAHSANYMGVRVHTADKGHPGGLVPLPKRNAGQFDVERTLLGAPWVPTRAAEASTPWRERMDTGP